MDDLIRVLNAINSNLLWIGFILLGILVTLVVKNLGNHK